MSTNVETPDEALIPLPQPGSTGDELFQMGMLYSTGQGGAPLDYISAHMLFNLAAMRGSEAAKAYRKEVSQEMDAAEVAEAQRQAAVRRAAQQQRELAAAEGLHLHPAKMATVQVP